MKQQKHTNGGFQPYKEMGSPGSYFPGNRHSVENRIGKIIYRQGFCIGRKDKNGTNNYRKQDKNNMPGVVSHVANIIKTKRLIGKYEPLSFGYLRKKNISF